MDAVTKTLGLISIDPIALEIFNKLLSSSGTLPNIPFPTMGGRVFWNTYCEVNGWKLQQNMITQHARIINSNNIRIAWGSISAIMTMFNNFVEMQRL